VAPIRPCPSARNGVRDGAAVIRGLLRLSVLGAGAAWVGDQVLRRRAPGPVPPISMMIVIDAPIERVWRIVSDIEGQPRWMRDMKTVRMLTPGPTRVGSRGESTVRMFGVSSADPVTVTAFDPPTSFAVSHEGTFAGSGVFRLEPGVDGTTTIVHWDETLTAPVLPHLAAVATTPVFRHVFERDLERLRDLVEAAGDEGPAPTAVS
jgi:uncharacterized protein YndB with AHSA1/START domain